MVGYSTNTQLLLSKIIIALSHPKYKGSEALAQQYINDMYHNIENRVAKIGNNISKRKHKGYTKTVVRYFRYKRNQNTQWLVYYVQEGDNYIIIKIANNHSDHAALKGLL